MKKSANPPGVAHALAPAKINPWLEVLGRRPDGYHDIQTWMLAIDLCDRIDAVVQTTPGIALEIDGPHASADIPRDASNLCWRAAAAALDAVQRARPDGPAPGVRIHLEKNIPSQSGLGGASADAAATWLAVLAAFAIETPESVALEALAALGSDCVFFAKASTTGLAWCEGRGERVSSAPRARVPWFVALLTPSVRCPTAAVYAAFRKPLRDSHIPHNLPPAWFEMPASTVRRLLFNELESAAVNAVPALAPWRETLDACGGEHFRLSGSGSSFFGLFDTRDEATSVLDRIASEANQRGLHARGRWIARPSGFGATLSAGSSAQLSKDL